MFYRFQAEISRWLFKSPLQGRGILCRPHSLLWFNTF